MNNLSNSKIKENSNTKCKFAFNFTPVILALLVAVFLICALSIFYSISTFINPKGITTLTIVINAVSLLFSVFLIVEVFGLLLFCYYIVDDKGVSLRLGVFKINYKKTDFHSLKEFGKSKKLVLYFLSGKYTVIVIDSGEYLAFSKTVSCYNPNLPIEIDDDNWEK